MDIEDIINKLKYVLKQNGLFKELHKKYYGIFLKNGSFFNHCSKDGVALSIVYLNKIEDKLSCKNKEMYFYQCLNKVTLLLSAYSGYNDEEWERLIIYLCDSNSRILNPTITLNEKKEKVNLIKENPFIITLLLMETFDPS